MIELYRRDRPSELADEVEATLAELVVDHAVHRVSDPSEAPAGDLPSVRDGERIVAPGELPEYLEELRSFVGSWYAFQSDACYIMDDGTVC